MKTLPTKCLAVLAVLAMLFASAAVVTSVGDLSATETPVLGPTGQSFTIKTGESSTSTTEVSVYAQTTMVATQTSSGAAFSGYATNYSPNFGLDCYAAYAEVELFFGDLNSALSGGSISITQKTSFHSLFKDHLNNNQSVDTTAGTFTAVFNTETFATSTYSVDGALGILVPVDGSKVTLTIETYSGPLNTDKAKEYYCTGDLLGTTTYVLDFADATTSATLPAVDIPAATWAEQKWSWTSSSTTLAFSDNYTANLAFMTGSGALVVTIPEGKDVTLTSADPVGVLKSAGALTIKGAVQNKAGTLNLYQMDDAGYATYSTTTTTVGDGTSTTEDAGYDIELNAYGGLEAIHATTTVGFNGAQVYATAAAGAIVGLGGWTTSTAYSEIVAEIDGSADSGTVPVFGIIVGNSDASIMTVGVNVHILTDGLYLNSTSGAAYVNNGHVVVLGDYQQLNYTDVYGITGIFAKTAGTTAYVATSVDSVPDVTVTGTTYVVGEAQAFNVDVSLAGGVTVVKSTKTGGWESQNAMKAAIDVAANANVKQLVLVPTGTMTDIDLTALLGYANLASVEELTIVKSSGSLATVTATKEVDVSSRTVTFNGVTVNATFENGTDSVRVVGGTGNFSVSKGSIHIDGSAAGSYYVSGDADLSGMTTGAIYIYAEEDAEGANLEILAGYSISEATGSLSITGLDVTIDDKIVMSNAAAQVYFKTGTTFSAPVVIDGTGKVKSDVEFTKDLVLSGTAITIQSDIAATEDLTLTADAVNANQYSITVGGDLYIAEGSAVTVTGTASAIEAVLVEGDAEIDGTLSLNLATLTLKGTTQVAGEIYYGDNVKTVITNSGTMTVSGLVSAQELPDDSDDGANSAKNFINNGVLVIKGTVVDVTNNKTIRLYGNIGYTYVDALDMLSAGNLVNDSTIIVMDVHAAIDASRTGSGTIDKSAVVSDAYLIGDIVTSQTPFSEWQRVIVNQTTTLHENARIIVKGDMVVTDGTLLTIQNGASLEIRGAFAKLTNDGTISVEGTDPTNGALFINGSEFINNATLSAVYDGTATTPKNINLAEKSVVTNNGEIYVSEGNILVIDGEGSTFQNLGSLKVEGKISATNGAVIKNSNTVSINSTAQQTGLVISNAATDATVEVKAVYGDFVVNDAAFVTTGKVTGTNRIDAVVGATVRANDSDAYVGGFVITESTFKNVLDDSKVTPRMTISGTIELDSDYSDIKTAEPAKAATVTLTGFVDVPSELSVESGVILSLADTTLMNVAGSVTIDDDALTEGEAGAAMIVTGSVLSYDRALDENIALSAAYYVIPKSGDSPKCYVYMAFADAIKSAELLGITTVTAYGDVDNGTVDGVLVSENVTVPAGMTVKIQSGSLVIAKDVLVLVPYDQSANTILNLQTGADIKVNGKLTFQNQAKGFRGSTESIDSEVVVSSGAQYTYTTLAWAIADVGTEEATLTLSGNTVIKNNTTIPSNITVDTDGHDFTIADDVTLTIDGTLYLNGGNYSVSEDDAKVVLNGFITKESAMTYDGLAYPAGLYYTVNDAATYVITSIDNAEISALVADGKMTYRGDLSTNDIDFDVKGEIEFTGTVKAKSLDIGSDAKITFDDDMSIDAVAMGNATIIIKAGSTVDGLFSSTVGAVAFTEAYAVKDSTIKVATASGVTNMSLAGKVAAVDDDEFEIATSGLFTLTADLEALKVGSGTTTIGANVTIPEVEIDGTLVVDNGYTLTSTAIIVNGALEAKEATTSAGKGSVDAEEIAVGVKFMDDVAATSTVSGDVSVDYAYVGTGSTVPESIETMAYSTVVYVERSPVMTVYGVSARNIDGIQYAFDLGFSDSNAEFKGWKDADGKDIANPKIGTDPAIYAQLNYDVYTVYIVSDAGVKSVSIEGKELIAEGNNVFVSYDGVIGYKLSYGTYKVTYTLKSGYEGNAQLYTKTGTILQSNSFVISPGADSLDVELQLIGTQKEVTPEPEPTPTPEEKSEWTITTILLLVLVILIAIMAVIVAMRLNRN